MTMSLRVALSPHRVQLLASPLPLSDPRDTLPPTPTPHQLTELHNQQKGQCLHADAQALRTLGCCKLLHGVGGCLGHETAPSIRLPALCPDPNLPAKPNCCFNLLGLSFSRELTPLPINTHSFPCIPTSGPSHCLPVSKPDPQAPPCPSFWLITPSAFLPAP